MGKASREKGKRGEREVVALLESVGYSARRGQQYRGGADSPDVVCPDLPFVVEVKLRASVSDLDLATWIAEAEADAAGAVPPLVLFRTPRQPWRAAFRCGPLVCTALAEPFLIRARRGELPIDIIA